MKTDLNAIGKLRAFVSQRPGLEYCNYGEPKSYRQESREITADLHDFRELLSLASCVVDELNFKVEKYLKESSSRLTLDESGNLQYCTGQYFPTEYRPAACRVLSSILWNEVRTAYPEYDGYQLRAYFKKRLSRRVSKYYFN